MTDDSPLPADPNRPYRILVVCTGNICRSPMGAVVLRERLREAGLDRAVEVDSAGISDEEHGNPIDPRAQSVLAEHGYPVPAHSAHQVTAHELTDYDLALAMTAQHERALARLADRAPGEAARISMWREFDATAPARGTGGADLDVPDPWYGPHDGFYDTLAVVERGADGLVEHLRDRVAPTG
ncbi:low molecular weight protein-tyrosine-phosphatase [Georgenia deserti]|uniref:protein-tyrosine-phosphatase n=1 Tax=Georgenia deserti TaxID=2093781 RepID=A0ABW4L3S1_9MICO